MEDVADAAEHLGGGPGGYVPVGSLAVLVVVVLAGAVVAERVGGGEGAIGCGEEPCEGEREG